MYNILLNTYKYTYIMKKYEIKDSGMKNVYTTVQMTMILLFFLVKLIQSGAVTHGR